LRLFSLSFARVGADPARGRSGQIRVAERREPTALILVAERRGRHAAEGIEIANRQRPPPIDGRRAVELGEQAAGEPVAEEVPAVDPVDEIVDGEIVLIDVRNVEIVYFGLDRVLELLHVLATDVED